MINWESILPKKLEYEIGLGTPSQVEHNEVWWRFYHTLKAAEARGEICKPLSVHDIKSLMHNYGYLVGDSMQYVAEAIHNVMIGKPGNAPIGKEG